MNIKATLATVATTLALCKAYDLAMNMCEACGVPATRSFYFVPEGQRFGAPVFSCDDCPPPKLKSPGDTVREPLDEPRAPAIRRLLKLAKGETL